jgi:lycopene beta-cyclase
VLTTGLGDRIVLNAQIEALGSDWVRLADGRRLTADLVIDGRGPTVTPDLVLGYQKFLGRTVRLAADHGLDAPIIMDATVDQDDGYRFIYVLPWDARVLLIEDTRYSDGPDLDRDNLRRGIGDYARGQGWTIEAVLEEEEGILPVALDGNIEGHWRRAERRALSGLRAALFHPTTGYSLPDAAALADAICGLATIDAPSVERLIRERSIRLWRDRAFLRLLNRMLFRAARPGERYRVLERFYGLPESLIARFYAAKLTALDKLRILSGKPPVPIGAALRCIAEKGHA